MIIFNGKDFVRRPLKQDLPPIAVRVPHPCRPVGEREILFLQKVPAGPIFSNALFSRRPRANLPRLPCLPAPKAPVGA